MRAISVALTNPKSAARANGRWAAIMLATTNAASTASAVHPQRRWGKRIKSAAAMALEGHRRIIFEGGGPGTAFRSSIQSGSFFLRAF